MQIHRRALLTLALAFSATTSMAQDFPTQPLKWVVPYPPGGGTDIVARTLAVEMSQILGQSVVVDNRPGANTIIGAEFLSKSRADGYTIGSADNSTLALNPDLYAKLPYNAAKDFVMLGGVVRYIYVLLVGPSVQARTLADFLEVMRKSPGRTSLGTPGLGGANHVAMEQFQQRVGVKFNHIAYRGGAPAVQDLLAGQIDCMLIDAGSSMPYIKSGKLRALAIVADRRLPQLPDVPTFAEAGVKDFNPLGWQMLVAPAGTPRPVVEKLSKALQTALQRDSVKARMAELAIESLPMDPDQASRFIVQEQQTWGSVIRTNGIKLEN